jgi:hypothetical protein
MSFYCPKCNALNLGGGLNPRGGCECCGFDGHRYRTTDSTHLPYGEMYQPGEMIPWLNYPGKPETKKEGEK